MVERKPGEASIRPEFQKEKWNDDEVVEMDDGENEAKSLGKSNSQKKNRGMNKGKRGKKAISDEFQICNSFARGAPCDSETCRFSHDLQGYLDSKAPDLGDRCVLFELFGECFFGYKCRYLKGHIDENNQLIKNEKLASTKAVYVKNGLNSDVQRALRRKTYEFPKSAAYMREIEAERQTEAPLKRDLEQDSHVEGPPAKIAREEGMDLSTADVSTADLPEIDMNVPPSEDKSVGPIDTDFRKTIDFRDKTYLAPLTTVGNLPFRRICKGFGVDITCGEMALASNLLQGQQSEWALTKRHVSEDIFGVQICGGKAEQVVKACELLNKEADINFVDLNMGCPIDLVVNQGAGSSLITTRTKMYKILKGMQKVLDVPVTAKFRMGFKDTEPIADKVVSKLEELNICLGTLHGRSRAQRYSRLADWDYIGTIKKQAKIPIFGNGDVLSFEDYYNNKEQTGVDGIMIGRGALIKPWVFDEIRERRHWDISSRERFDMLKKFCDYGLEHWGTDTQGVNATRRYLCEWQSFLYRYIPVGILEVVPQKINERAPPYFGRDDLETLMASPASKDWVKISEMLLGPAPSDFVFEPKHKANSVKG